MTVEFSDPFAFYETDASAADGHYNDGMRKYWDAVDGDGIYNSITHILVVKDGGREGRGCIELHGNNPAFTKNVTSSSEYIVQFALKVLTVDQTYAKLNLHFKEGTATHGVVEIINNYAKVTDASGADVGSTVTLADWKDGYWHLFEFKMSFGDSGNCQLWVDETLFVDQDGDFNNSGTAIDTVYLSMVQVGYDTEGVRICDFLIINTQVSPITERIGDAAVFYSVPKSDIVSGFTPLSGTDHFALVDNENFFDSESTYVYSTGTNQLELHKNNEDGNYDPLSTVIAVAPVVYAGLYTGTSGVGLIPVIRLSDVDYPRTTYDAFTSETPEVRVCDYIYENPGTSLEFSIDEVEAFTFGFKTASS